MGTTHIPLMPSTLRRSLVILAASISTALAQQPAAEVKPAVDFKPTPASIELKDGDSWVFLGDSITHQCLYTQYVEDYVYTRYPKLHIHFHNAGVGGDRASDALVRFDEDVAAKKPKYCTILLGMNDGGYRAYDQPTFDTYQQGMTTILDKLAGIGAQAIPMTPTMFDSRASKLAGKPGGEVKQQYYNGVLSLYGSWLREQAYDRGLEFVDMWGPLNDYTVDARKKDPKFTMIPDSVHPGPAGQVVMAVALIENSIVRSQVSQVTVGQEKGQAAIHATHGTAANLQKTDKGVTFDFTADSLPWVLPPDAAAGFLMTHAGHHFSTEKVFVRDLAPGNYELKIDGTSVAKVSSGQLAQGVELETNEATPQYQQALKVAMLNKQRNDEGVRMLRNEWGTMKGKRRAVAKAENDKTPDLADKKKELEDFTPIFHTRIEGYIAKAQSLEDEIYKANQPVSHHYEVVPAQAVAAK